MTSTGNKTHESDGDLWEVFIQSETGSPHEHCGSVHAPDAEMAIENARDTYARRGKIVSIWVVPARSITATSPSDSGPFFDPSDDKAYRHPQFYSIPKSVKGF